MQTQKIIINEYPIFDARDANGYKPKTYRSLRLSLLEVYDTCYWCGIKIYDHPQENGKPSKPDLATIDHLIQRPQRKKGDVVGKVLACYRCNTRRSVQRLAK